MISVPWKSVNHINVCEARARSLAQRWRAKDPRDHGKKFLHLMDSQVNLAVAAKGRTSSKRLAHVVRKSSATALATNMRDVNAFTRSDKPPADKPSRDAKAWKTFRRRLSSTCKAAAPVAYVSAEGERQAK